MRQPIWWLAPHHRPKQNGRVNMYRWFRLWLRCVSSAYVDFRCENIDINTAMNKCQFELYRFTVFSVRNHMYLYRFMNFQELKNSNQPSWKSSICWFSSCCRRTCPILSFRSRTIYCRFPFKIKFLHLIRFHLVKRSIIISRYFKIWWTSKFRDTESDSQCDSDSDWVSGNQI